MKKIIFVFSCILLLNCSSNTIVSECFKGIQVDEIINFQLPEYQNLLVDGGRVSSFIDGRNIQIIRNSSSNYLAFDLECPEQDCNSPMTFDSISITCPCSNKKYNYLQGGAPVDGNGCAALIYLVEPISSTSIRITR